MKLVATEQFYNCNNIFLEYIYIININKKDTNTSVKDKSTSCFSFLPISVDNWCSFISFKLV